MIQKAGRPQLLLLAALAWASGCSDIPSAPSDPLDTIPGLIVSGSPPVTAGVRTSVGGAQLSEARVFVSLPPGSVAQGERATIRDQATGQSVTAPVVDGGFDPVAVAGGIGDTLVVEVRRSGTLDPIRDVELVRHRPPVVVRTNPPPKKADVPLNSIMLIVFSQPIDPATLNPNSLKLLRGTTPVAGTLGFGDPNQVTVVFSSATLLAPHTAYRLVATSAIADLLGSTLEADFAADFTTGAAATSEIASVSILPDTATVPLGDGAQLVAVVRDAQGATLPGAPVTWASDAATVATVSSGGLVSTVGLGSVTISASAGGRVGTARLSVVRPPPPTGLVFASVSAGFNHACGLSTSGRAYCWGDNQSGQLGDGTWTTSATPVAVLGGHTFRSVSAGQWFNCGVTTSDQAYCWGSNGEGQLGNGHQPGNGEVCCSLAPVAVVGGLSLRSVSASQNGYFACGVTTSGQIYCWGVNNSNAFPNSNVPILIEGSVTFATVSSGSDHACGLTASGQAYCWGYNRWGQIGSGDTSHDRVFPPPPAVAGGLSFGSVQASQYFTCGVTTSGADYCWGAGFVQFPTDAEGQTFCELDSCSPFFPVPAALTLSPSLATLSVQQRHSCGLTAAGAAYCWGYNWAGQLGTGDTESSPTAVAVVGGLTFAALSVGNGFACGVTPAGVAYCWGYNSDGQLGTGTGTNSSVPARVGGQP